MAKKTGTMGKKSNKNKNKGKVVRGVAKRQTMQLEPRVLSHVRMLADPCNAIISPTAYRGKDGFVNRFTQIYSTAPNTGTCSIIAFWPRYNRVFQRNIGTDNDPFSLNMYDPTYSKAGPGGAFLGTNAGETRPVAACITSSYIGTELDRQGYIVSGVVPYGTTTGTLTLSQLRTICQRWQRTADGEVETKWIPTPSDEEYEQIPATLPASPTDDNIVVHINCGFAESKDNFYHRVVSVTEWQPYYGLGISCPNPSTPDVPGGLEKVRSVLASMGNWWQEATHTAATAVRVGTRMYAGARALGAVATQAAPLLLTA